MIRKSIIFTIMAATLSQHASPAAAISPKAMSPKTSFDKPRQEILENFCEYGLTEQVINKLWVTVEQEIQKKWSNCIVENQRTEFLALRKFIVNHTDFIDLEIPYAELQTAMNLEFEQLLKTNQNLQKSISIQSKVITAFFESILRAKAVAANNRQ